MDDILQLKITLSDTKPPIWRRVLVDKNYTFYDLHLIIQVAMGWENCHLFEFKVHNYRFGEPDDEFDLYAKDKLLDAAAETLGSVLTTTAEKFEYEYDFGDGWKHQIEVEEFLPRESKAKYPLCTAGELNCPPEDCGGVWGYYALLKILQNKKHPEREDMIAWLGRPYDADDFNLARINKNLTKLSKSLKGS
jgi:hypothetical protein